MSRSDPLFVISALGISPNVRTVDQSREEVRVRFFSYCESAVDLVWIDHSGRAVRYAKLLKRQYIDISTFEGHPWLFRDSVTGEPLSGIVGGNVSEKNQVFWPPAPNNNHVIQRVGVLIVPSLHTLQELCIRSIALRIKVNSESICSLQLPNNLANDLRSFLLRLLRYRELVSPNQLIAPSQPSANNN